MEIPSDTYKTILKPTKEILFKDKRSKFYGYAFPIRQEDQVKPIIESLRKKHPAANHVCYAWQLGTQERRFRVNDDGEPNNSAGMPIYGQIKSREVTNLIIAVVRVFGGTKLGVGGLIQAYKTAAEMTLESANVVVITIKTEFKISFPYSELDKVMRILKRQGAELVSQQMELECTLHFNVRQSEAERMEILLGALHKIRLKRLA